MDIAFLDSSAFFKLYRSEIGSNWLKAFVSGKKIAISQLALVEVATIIGRLYREGVYTRDEAVNFYNLIFSERRKYTVYPLGSNAQIQGVVSITFDLPINVGVQALDGIHLSVAKIIQDEANLQTLKTPLIFVTADKNLVKAAWAAGFVVENPNDYP